MRKTCEICLTVNSGMRHAKRVVCIPCLDKVLEAHFENATNRMNCWNCGTQMIWGGEHSFDDVGMDGEGIASNFSCPTCSAHADFYVPI